VTEMGREVVLLATEQGGRYIRRKTDGVATTQPPTFGGECPGVGRQPNGEREPKWVSGQVDELGEGCGPALDLQE
jgi:hypothetical protein